MAKNPFDPAEIFKAFSPDAMAKAFDPNAMMNAFQEAGKNLPDLADVFDANKRHFEATAEANKAAAAGYKDMLEKQMEIFREVTEPVQKMMMDAADPATIKAQTDAMSEAVQNALALMQNLAEASRVANEKAFEEVKAEVTKTVKRAAKS